MAWVVAHLIATNFYGGPEKQILEHLQRLDRHRFRGLVFSFLEGGRNALLDKAAAFKVAHGGIAMRGLLDVKAQQRLNLLLREQQVDLLCTHGYKATVMGWWAARKNRIPVLAFSRGYTAENRKVAVYEWLDRQVLKRVDGIIAVSEGQRQRLAAYGVRGRRSWVVHNAVAVPSAAAGGEAAARTMIRKEFGIGPGSPLVVAAGRLSPEKGHRFLVEAIALLGGRAKQTVFVFCGDGPCRGALEQQARRLGVARQCRFAGFRDDIQRFFQAMDLMVLPSLTEGLPNVVLESFALAKPVVATRVGGVPELVVDGENGILVEPGRPERLAAAVSGCLADQGRMTAMGQAGRRLVQSRFSFENQKESLQQIYAQLLATPSRQGPVPGQGGEQPLGSPAPAQERSQEGLPEKGGARGSVGKHLGKER